MILMYFFVHYYNQGIVFKTFDKVFVLFLYPIIDFLRVVTARLISFKNLALGDIIILNDKEEKIIIERKSISDLAASIKDGRANKQNQQMENLKKY